MNLRYVVAAALAVAVAAGAPTAGARTDGTDAAKATTLTVWLMTDAQGPDWAAVVSAANRAFEAAHSDVNVKVEIQTWGDHLTKLDAALAGGRAPDVIELGNTETTKYMAAGALANITSSKARFPNNKTWLKALTGSCTYQARLFCVPYYAGARAVIYRKDHYAAAGMRKAPTSLDQFVSYGKKVMARHKGDSNYSALYFPGKYWYAGMAFVYDYGGAIARFKKGRWVGTLNSPQALAGLTKLKATVRALSRANRSGTEANQWTVFSQGHVGSIIANGWEWGLSRHEDRRPGARPAPRRVPDAEPQQGQVHADVPRRLRSRDPGVQQQQDARGRLDPGLHVDAHDASADDRGPRDPEHDVARRHQRQQADARPVRERRRRRAGSSRPPPTG